MRSSRRPRRAADGACCPVTCRRPSPCRAASTRNIALALITAEHAVLSEHVMVLVNGVPSQARIGTDHFTTLRRRWRRAPPRWRDPGPPGTGPRSERTGPSDKVGRPAAIERGRSRGRGERPVSQSAPPHRLEPSTAGKGRFATVVRRRRPCGFPCHLVSPKLAVPSRQGTRMSNGISDPDDNRAVRRIEDLAGSGGLVARAAACGLHALLAEALKAISWRSPAASSLNDAERREGASAGRGAAGGGVVGVRARTSRPRRSRPRGSRGRGPRGRRRRRRPRCADGRRGRRRAVLRRFRRTRRSR